MPPWCVWPFRVILHKYVPSLVSLKLKASNEVLLDLIMESTAEGGAADMIWLLSVSVRHKLFPFYKAFAGSKLIFTQTNVFFFYHIENCPFFHQGCSRWSQPSIFFCKSGADHVNIKVITKSFLHLENRCCHKCTFSNHSPFVMFLQ